MNSKFIVIEGLEGAGKTTARDAIVSELQRHGINDIVFTREPGGTPLAEKLRDLIKQGIEGERVAFRAGGLLFDQRTENADLNAVEAAFTCGFVF